ncbi:MAG: hypothetical protein SFX18_03270 [Pirellulales bacterium]|nr:hypothetical protein [Pirellulales bacterium]
MWRAFFLAVGIFAVILGVEFLIIEQATLISSRDIPNAQTTQISPPDWAPWSLMSAGVVVILYSFTLPKRLQGGK